MYSSKRFSGLTGLNSSVVSTVICRRPGEVGRKVLIPIHVLHDVHAQTPSKISSFSPGFSVTIAFFQSGFLPTILPIRRILPPTFITLTFSTLTFKAEKVSVMNVGGKIRRIGRMVGKKPDWKKAIVTLKPGEKLEIFEGV